MSYPFLSAVAVMALSAAAPALAVQAAGGATPPTRAAVIQTADRSFAETDTNKDGNLTKNEVDAATVRAQQRAAATIQQRVNQEFTKLDTDKNGQLSVAEFRAAAPAMKPNPGAGATAMQRLDVNKDGKINAAEYRAPILATFNRIDTNKDGTISTAERTAATNSRRR